MRILFLLIPLIFAISTPTASAQDTYAVIIGISKYRYNHDLNYMIEYLENFKNFLKSDYGGNVPDSNIVFLKNSEASYVNIMKQSKKLFAKARENDRVYFCYGGHGNYGVFGTYDSINQNDVLFYSEIKEIMRTAKCKTKIIIGETCHSGSLRTSDKRITQIQKEISLMKSDTSTNIAAMLSSRAEEVSWSGYFLKAINIGLKGKADANQDSLITIEELYYFVRKKTRAYAAETGKVQTPVLFGNFDLNLVIGRNYNKNPLYHKIDDEVVKELFHFFD